MGTSAIGRPGRVKPGSVMKPLFLRCHGQPEDRRLPLSGHVEPAQTFFMRQVQASCNAHSGTPPRPVPRHLRHRRRACSRPRPSYKTSASNVRTAEFTLGVFFVAGALSRLLDLHFVMGKLRRSSYSFDGGQEQSSSLRQSARRIYEIILLEGFQRSYNQFNRITCLGAACSAPTRQERFPQ